MLLVSKCLLENLKSLQNFGIKIESHHSLGMKFESDHNLRSKTRIQTSLRESANFRIIGKFHDHDIFNQKPPRVQDVISTKLINRLIPKFS